MAWHSDRNATTNHEVTTNAIAAIIIAEALIVV